MPFVMYFFKWKFSILDFVMIAAALRIGDSYGFAAGLGFIVVAAAALAWIESRLDLRGRL